MGIQFRLAILFDPLDPEPPSDLETIKHFTALARKRKIHVIIGDSEYLEKIKYDALFIRQGTEIGNAAYKLSKKAFQSNTPVIDDPASIEASCDKLLMMQRFAERNIPAPLSIPVRVGKLDYDAFNQIRQQIAQIGFPVVLKDPASSFSRGVFKAKNENELLTILKKLEGKTKDGLIQVQEFVPTRFDWRVGVLNHQVLYVCQYNMVPGHWQVIKHNGDGTYCDGSYLTLPEEHWPYDICELGVQAAACVGSGLYGVDIKETKSGPLVIEVNDNPTIDMGNEDRFTPVWGRIIDYFVLKIREKHGEKLCSASSKNPSPSIQVQG
jgi:glutathione synthase/RimK-type ligase-like ATP-grasp enzyme